MRFTIEFEHNRAVKATGTNPSLKELKIDFEEVDGNTVIRELIIEAETEQEAIEAANILTAQLWSELLVGK